jgi:integrase/recombinase XerD
VEHGIVVTTLVYVGVVDLAKRGCSMHFLGENGVIEQYMTDCSNRGNDEKTQKLRWRLFGWLVPWLEKKGVTELEDVTLSLLRQFLSFLLQSGTSDRCEVEAKSYSDKLASSTVAMYISYLKAFFSWCYQEEYVEKDPAARLKKPKVPDKVVAAFTQEHLDKLLEVCDTGTNNGFRDYVILLVLLDTGMRVSELCGLRLSDVYPKYVRVDGKGQKEREIGLHSDVSKLLRKYISKCRPSYASNSEYVFLGRQGPLTISGVEYIIKKLKNKSGIDISRATPHVFRHTHSKQYLKRGGDLFKLSRELGHASVQVTAKIYLGDYKSSDARDDHDKYSPIEDIKPKGLRDNKGGGKGKKRV